MKDITSTLIKVQGIKKETPDEVVDYLDPTEYGEASEKAHCASYQAQLGFHCHLQIISTAERCS